MCTSALNIFNIKQCPILSVEVLLLLLHRQCKRISCEKSPPFHLTYQPIRLFAPRPLFNHANCVFSPSKIDVNHLIDEIRCFTSIFDGETIGFFYACSSCSGTSILSATFKRLDFSNHCSGCSPLTFF